MPDPWKVLRRLLLRTARGFDAVARFCSSLAAGTLRRADIRTDTETNWGRFHTQDSDVDKGLFPWEQRLMEGFVHPADRILVIGCGTGRDVIPLAANGHRVTGVEPAAQTVALARTACVRHGVAADIIHGYFEDVALPAPFEVVVFSYLCYGYIPESTRRIEALRKARALLVEGGRILISCVGNELRPNSRLITLAKVGARLRRSDWHPEPGDIVQPMPSGSPRFHYEHIFVPGELEAEVAAAGLRVIFHDHSSFDYWIAALAA